MSLRIALVTPLFPIHGEPYRGIPIYNTALELRNLADVQVFCPFAVYPRWKVLQPSSYVYRPPDKDFQPPLIPVEYVRYFAVPGVSRPLNAWNCRSALLPALRRFAPDLVLAYWLYPEGRGALLAARNLGLPVVGGARGSDMKRPPDPLSRYLLQRTVRTFDGVLTVSEELRRSAISLGADPSRVRTVLNGCDTRIYHAANRDEARSRLGLPADAEIVLFVGHLVPWKGISELIEAFILLASDRPNLRLICVGEGVWNRAWDQRLRDQGLDRRVLLPGGCTPVQVAEWMAAADVFCLPSHSEGCPNVVIEALACGRPVVATTVGAIPDLVNSDCGFLVAPGRPVELAAALQRALEKTWNSSVLSSAFRRGWADAAGETLDFCTGVASRFRAGARGSR